MHFTYLGHVICNMTHKMNFSHHHQVNYLLRACDMQHDEQIGLKNNCQDTSIHESGAIHSVVIIDYYDM